MSDVTPPASGGGDMRALIERAMRLAHSGQQEEAEPLFREVIRQHPDSIEAHSFFGALAFQRRQYADSIAAYEKCTGLQPQNPEFHANLAAVKELAGDLPGAIDAYLSACRLNPCDARLALFAGAALEAAGRREEAAVLFTLGDDVSPALRAAKDHAQFPPEIRARSAIADRVMREHFTRLHARAIDEAERDAGKAAGGMPPDLSRVRRAIWTQTHDGQVTFRTPEQRPTIFYMPDLEALPVTPREKLPWAEKVEAATADVRDEYLAQAGNGAQLAPYVDPRTRDPIWNKLRGRMEWSSLHLFKSGQETQFAKLFPRTLTALEAAEVFRLEDGSPLEVFFSRLKPGTHIPPHVGTCNHRLTVHLPLIVPENCAIRVKDHTHVWREGELFAFDDSFEHEAWNRSDTDRVVLIFETHRPDVSPEERLAIEHTFNVRKRWLMARRIPEPA